LHRHVSGTIKNVIDESTVSGRANAAIASHAVLVAQTSRRHGSGGNSARIDAIAPIEATNGPLHGKPISKEATVRPQSANECDQSKHVGWSASDTPR